MKNSSKLIKYIVIAYLLCSSLMGSVFAIAHASDHWSPQTPVQVKTYTKKDGTVIHNHYRAKPGKGCGGHGCKN